MYVSKQQGKYNKSCNMQNNRPSVCTCVVSTKQVHIQHAPTHMLKLIFDMSFSEVVLCTFNCFII